MSGVRHPYLTDALAGTVIGILLGLGIGGAFYLAVNEDPSPTTPAPTTTSVIDGIPLFLDGERLGDCELNVSPDTVGNLRCYDLDEPTP